MTLAFEIDPLDTEEDEGVRRVFARLRKADPDGSRIARLMRQTLDQLYDGQRTGRYSWDQLSKTERSHFGTLFEINLRRAFADVFDDGVKLDYRVDGLDVDCKFSQKIYGWMIPPEAVGEILVVGYVNDVDSEYAFGVVRARPEYLNTGTNRDAKATFSAAYRAKVRWLQWPGELPANILLHIDEDTRADILGKRSGQQRLNELLRRVTGRAIGRGVIATVAQQDDFMKRVRANGGARSTLKPEGIIILSGDYSLHRGYAEELGVEIPDPGEVVSVRVVRASEDEPSAEIDGDFWRIAGEREEVTEPAPDTPHMR